MLSQAELIKYLHYSPKTGLFTRRLRTGAANAGDVAGGIDKESGYIRISVKGKQRYAHRLAVLYMEGYFPEYQIDHKNGRRNDNSYKNLRHVRQTCNNQNSDIRKDNSSGFKGVCEHKDGRVNKYYSRIYINGKCIRLGSFPTLIEAAVARLEAEIVYPEWNCDHRGINAKRILRVLSDNGQTRLAKKLKKQLKNQGR